MEARPDTSSRRVTETVTAFRDQPDADEEIAGGSRSTLTVTVAGAPVFPARSVLWYVIVCVPSVPIVNGAV